MTHGRGNERVGHMEAPSRRPYPDPASCAPLHREPARGKGIQLCLRRLPILPTRQVTNGNGSLPALLDRLVLPHDRNPSRSNSASISSSRPAFVAAAGKITPGDTCRPAASQRRWTASPLVPHRSPHPIRPWAPPSRSIHGRSRLCSHPYPRGRLAQGESASLTRKRSEVQILYRPPYLTSGNVLSGAGASRAQDT